MIHVLDVLVVVPGRLGDVRRSVDHEYRPLMADLGMRLERTWIAPAVELLDQPTELLLLWALDDVAAFWRMRTTAARDPRVVAFWERIAPLVTRRERKLMCDPSDPAVMR